MKFAVLAEASTLGRGNIFWYLKTFFVEEDAYDDPDIKYFRVREPYQITIKLKHWVQPKEIDAIEVHFSGRRPTNLHAWTRSTSGRSTPLSGNILHDFGKLIEIHELRRVDLPEWTGG